MGWMTRREPTLTIDDGANFGCGLLIVFLVFALVLMLGSQILAQMAETARTGNSSSRIVEHP